MPKRRPRRGTHRRGRVAAVVFLLLLAIFGLGFYILDRNLFPIIGDASVRAARSAVNELLADSVRSYVREQGIASEDFYSLNQNAGMLSSLEVNTLLVNDICAEIADKISVGLSELEAKNIEIPAGTLGGWNFIANRGPFIGVKILPRGSVVCDYGSEFVSAGINQVNFQIWLDVRAEVSVVSIRQESPLVVERRIPIVNTVFTGETPDTYFKLDGGQ